MRDKMRQAIPVLNHFITQGFQAYFVGGCVRDSLLQRPFDDIDIITDATPEQVKQLFDKTIDTGIAHGTVTINYQGVYYEVTTFRTESDYQDYRRPNEVMFVTDIHEDLKRRDFTMNALAMDKEGHIIDDFQGEQHLQQQRIVTVGLAQHRFNEDALRMMRAYRFASQLGFNVDEQIQQACQQLAVQLNYIAVERVWIEMKKMLDGKYLQQAMPQLLSSGLVSQLPVLSRLSDEQLLFISQFQVNTTVIMSYYCYLYPTSEDLTQLKVSNKERLTYRQYAQVFHRLQKGEWWESCYDYQHLDEVIICQLHAVLQLDIDIIQWLKDRKNLVIHTPHDLALPIKTIIEQAPQPAGPWIKLLQQQLITAINSGQLVNHISAIQGWLNDKY